MVKPQNASTTSEAPQSLVLRPVFFVIYVNVFANRLKSITSKLAKDSEVGGKAVITKDCEVSYRRM